LSRAAGKKQPFAGRSARIDSVRALVERAAKTPFAVLLLGESGTGKEVAARAIHDASSRSDRQFVVIDCGSLVSTLVESELFGHVKGAFSGAIGNKVGLVEAADGGTLFLDEIGDLPLDLQVKLLRLLQEREFRPVGALFARSVDVRFVAATNRDLAADVAAGRFRLDLYQRLNVFPIHLPPLRERREDIPLLAEQFVKEIESMGLGSIALEDRQLRVLSEHAWPGNVRELKHCIERMAALGLDDPADLRRMLFPEGGASPATAGYDIGRAGAGRGIAADEPMSIREGELHLISVALAATSGNRAKAAEILRISRTTLYRRLRNAGRGTQAAGSTQSAGGARHRAGSNLCAAWPNESPKSA
jgi:DNA-binding NtrC family response regulator